MATKLKMLKRDGTEVIEAVHWWAMGDHAEVIPCSMVQACTRCAEPAEAHGQLTLSTHAGTRVNARICPGEWIVKHADGSYRVWSETPLHRQYQTIEEIT